MNTSQAICRMREVIRRQHKALSTEEGYVFWLRRYLTALREMPEGLSSEKKLEQFPTDLARRRDVSASTQDQAFNAILFFYRQVLAQPMGNVDALRAKRPVPECHAPCQNAVAASDHPERGRLPDPPDRTAALRLRIAGHGASQSAHQSHKPLKTQPLHPGAFGAVES